MYFWKIEKLKQDLIENGLSQSALFKYIFIYVFLSALSYELTYNFVSEESTNIDYIQSALNMALVGFATYFCYVANGGNNGADFAERFFSIGFVVSIRFIVLLVPIMIAMGFLFWDSEDIDDVSTKWYDVAVLSGWTALLYWRVVYHINQVAKQAHA
ncbi:MAG: hypothetical protein ACRBCS_15305 [Cellvibrionaceae bacterium]